MALESRHSAPPRRLGSPLGLDGPPGTTHAHLLRGIVWGLLFAAPFWAAVVVLALLVVRAQW